MPTCTPQTPASWVPMAALFLAQVLMSFNVSALPVSIGGIVDDFGVPPTQVSTAIVMYGLAVAALVMLGAKVGRRVGWTRAFRLVIALFGVSGVIMMSAQSVTWIIGAQALAGASAAIIVPSLVALIAENYQGAQQTTTVGSLGSARAISGVTAFFVGGALGTLVGWRPVFGIVVAIAAVVLVLSLRLRSDRGDAAVRIEGRRGAARRLSRRPAHPRVQQPQRLGRRARHAGRAVQRGRGLPRAGPRRRGHRARAGLLRLDPGADGGGP
ncbi:MFS transporter [Miniimonas arenae]|uniref:MFS transporter n=1 Tax=Miniimonas arenae TaxID=676201 RepID=UPI001FEC2A57|nr:MFS transporter [Miniimonas arenae]